MTTKTSLAPPIKPGGFTTGAIPPPVRKDGIYEVPGQHYYDGMYWSPLIIPAELDRIKNTLDFNEKDVISSSFPKTGMSRCVACSLSIESKVSLSERTISNVNPKFSRGVK